MFSNWPLRLKAILLSSLLLIFVSSSNGAVVDPFDPLEFMSPLFFDINFHRIINALGSSKPNLPGQCREGRDEILNKLNKIRKEHPEWFENIDYGPVIRHHQLFGHEGVVFYYKAKDENPDYTYEGYMKRIEYGAVVDYTNYFSDYTGHYRVRAYNAWKWYDCFGKGEINTDGDFLKFYWSPNGPKYPDQESSSDTEYSQHRRNPQFMTSLSITVDYSWDPNEKVGARGRGPDARYISGRDPLRYTIFFENKREATGPALVVRIVDQLNENLDLNTFTLGPISFGNRIIYPETRDGEFSLDYDLRPEKNAILRIRAGLEGNLATWEFRTVDPETGQIPLDPWAGFLPPNTNPPEGEGSVTFVVMAKRDLPTGTPITNRATIVFDLNDPIETNEWVNFVDNTKPQSRVLSLNAIQSSRRFLVRWSGDDTGSGIQSYKIYASENGGPYKIWLRDTEETTAFFTGRYCSSYSFYSIAQDNAGNLEDPPAHPNVVTVTPGMKRICSVLGDHQGGRGSDMDVFSLMAKENEKLMVLLEAEPQEAGTGKKAFLRLVGKIKGTRLRKSARGILPIRIETTIPKTGEYLITVSNQPNPGSRKTYIGGYCLTVEAPQETMETFLPYNLVEQVISQLQCE